MNLSKTSTALLLFALVNLAYSAGGACKYDPATTNGTHWNYLKVGKDWTCDGCKENDSSAK
jgi:hypothetical protein